MFHSLDFKSISNYRIPIWDAPFTTIQFLWILICEIGIGIIFSIQLLQISKGLTTNEVSNMNRLEYLHQGDINMNDNVFHNPFNNGITKNLKEFMFSSNAYKYIEMFNYTHQHPTPQIISNVEKCCSREDHIV